MQNKISKLLPHIGMRKIKSLIAVFIGFWLWQILRIFIPELEVHPIYIYIYGIIEIRDTSQKTVDFGKRRIKATFIAISIGLPLMFLSMYLKTLAQPAWLDIGVELVILLTGILLTLLAAEKVGCVNFCGLAAAIFVILIVAHSDGEPYLYAILRASQTIVGVFIAWLINVKILPYPKITTDS